MTTATNQEVDQEVDQEAYQVVDQAADQTFLDAAWRIGARLCRDAIWAGNKCNWVGPSMEYLDNSWKTVYRAYSSDIYSGTCGIGYFLSQLYSRSRDPIQRKTAIGCFEQAIANADKTPASARIGLYTGWAGMAYALRYGGRLLETDAFETPADHLLEAIADYRLEEGGIDMLAGCAGAIPVLLSFGRAGTRELEDKLLTQAKNIGDYLIRIAHKNGRGWSWNTLPSHSAGADGNLTGLSHGAAGIAWALVELYHVTKEETYLDAARCAFAYERQLFRPEYGNWPDLRSNQDASPGGRQDTAARYGMHAWCHGAPGIGLSRLRIASLVDDDACKEEAAAALASTSANIRQSLDSRQANFSLCHGIAGNTELLLMAADTSGSPQWLSFARQVGQAGLDRYARPDQCWPCGIMGAGETPGLLLGLAGIGYFYLRLSDPATVPSILLPLPLKEDQLHVGF